MTPKHLQGFLHSHMIDPRYSALRAFSDSPLMHHQMSVARESLSLQGTPGNTHLRPLANTAKACPPTVGEHGADGDGDDAHLTLFMALIDAM